MMHYVLDASVLVKWVLPERGELHTRQALALMDGFVQRTIEVVEPPHWLTEVAAVLARLVPERAREAVGWLHELQLPVSATVEVYDVGVRLATRHGHHLFDTLYHAVALASSEAVLVTADEAYFRKSRGEGRISRLADFPMT